MIKELFKEIDKYKREKERAEKKNQSLKEYREDRENALIYDVAKMSSVEAEEGISEELIEKEYKVRQYIHYVLQTTIFNDMKKKLPRSKFAGVRDERYKPKRSNKLRNSLEFKNTSFGKYRYELDGSVLKYPNYINDDPKFITYKYWDRLSTDVENTLFKKLQQAQAKFDITVRRRG